VKLTILRAGQEQEVEVKLGTRPHAETVATEPGTEETPGRARLGVGGVTLTPALAEAMDLPRDQQGVLIQQIELGSPADTAGLHGSFKPAVVDGQRVLVGGDVITTFANTAVTSVEDLVTALQHASPGQEVTLGVLRDGVRLEVSVRLDSGG
jgi:S1-C subfamily serine protease